MTTTTDTHTPGVAAAGEPCGCGHELGSTDKSVTDKAWDGSASRFTDEQYKMSSAACDGDGPPKTACFLPHHEPGGAVNRNGVHAAAQRVSSLKGKTANAVSRAKSHLRSHYKAMGEDPPDSIAASAAPDPQAGLGVATGDPTEPASELGLVAAEGPPDTATGLPARWHAYLLPANLRSTDRRMFARDGGIWRDLPLPLEWDPEGSGHVAPQIVGSIETIEWNDRDLMYATGPFDLGSEIGREAARQCLDKRLRWVSPRYEELASELIEIGGGAGGLGDPFLIDLFGPMPGGGDDHDWYELITEYRIMSAAMVTHPCYPQSVIVPEGEELPDVAPMGEAPTVTTGLIAASIVDAGVDLTAPPAAWFENPYFPCYSPMVVTREGRVMGHLAAWGVEHTSFPGERIYAPRSASNYAYAMTGRRLTAEGDLVPCGPITMATGHADLAFGLHLAAAHYDNTGTAVADVAYGEDDYGIWYSGALRPGVTDEQVCVMLASAPSGDWREVRGDLDLIATLMVNHPGFPPIPGSLAASATWQATSLVAGARARFTHNTSGEKRMVSLVAAGIVPRDPTRQLAVRLAALEGQLAALRRAVEPTVAASVEALRARLPQTEVAL